MGRKLGATWFFFRWIVAMVVFWRVWGHFGFWWGVLLGLFWEVWLVVKFALPWILHVLDLA